MFRINEIFFIILLIVVSLLNFRDLYNDYAQYQNGNYSLLDLGLEAFVILASTLGIAFLLRTVYQRVRDIDALRQQLKASHKNLSAMSASLTAMDGKMRQASRQYSEVIQEQLTAWEFTPSEKDIAQLLLKGLSFEEIALIREAKEKTVRQQATVIYRKSGTSGRHEFAAWFFEDFLH
ncbi:MAG: helix-turn-helix transcriptional regulator [Thiothrix lacustris]|uniref:Helix-turn-helix transcriptional regulator n=1 Tax=Thiothrix lacustris TaxID=525917 RepID=A0A1Y1QWQ5_9GAMM|nr:MAG: helix-turn-helix transcriptional regulator [Thiothrix lacustris]